MDRRIGILIGFAALLAVGVTIVLVARGGDGEGSEDAELTDTTTKPEIEVPDEPPPGGLVSEDLVLGEGAEAAEGDEVSVQYVGVDYETGEEFDSSWERVEPFRFELGAGQVIAGWDEGVVGMREGGRRELVIPPDLAYGAQGQPPAIGPDATLVFVIDLVSVN